MYAQPVSYHRQSKVSLQVDTKKLALELWLNSQDDSLLTAMLTVNACSTTDRMVPAA